MSPRAKSWAKKGSTAKQIKLWVLLSSQRSAVWDFHSGQRKAAQECCRYLPIFSKRAADSTLPYVTKCLFHAFTYWSGGSHLSCKDYDPTFLCTGGASYTKRALLILLHQQESLDPCRWLLKEKGGSALCMCLLSRLAITPHKHLNTLVHSHTVWKHSYTHAWL